MSELFTANTKEEFLASVDRGIAQAKNGQRQDAHEAVDEKTQRVYPPGCYYERRLSFSQRSIRRRETIYLRALLHYLKTSHYPPFDCCFVDFV